VLWEVILTPLELRRTVSPERIVTRGIETMDANAGESIDSEN